MKIRVEPPNGFVLAADHEAEPALEPEHAAARPAVDVVDPLRLELLRALDVVSVIAVAAVDDDVVRLHQLRELADHLACDRRRDHHPGGAGLVQRLNEVLERGRARCAVGCELGHDVGTDVVDDAIVAVAHQAPHDARAHAAEANHPKLRHSGSPFIPGPEVRSDQRRLACPALAVKPAPAAGGEPLRGDGLALRGTARGQSSLSGRPKRPRTSVANRSRAGPREYGVTNEVTSVARPPSRVSTSSERAV